MAKWTKEYRKSYNKEYSKLYIEKERERLKSYKAEWRRKNSVRLQQERKLYYEKNKSVLLDQQKNTVKITIVKF